MSVSSCKQSDGVSDLPNFKKSLCPVIVALHFWKTMSQPSSLFSIGNPWIESFQLQHINLQEKAYIKGSSLRDFCFEAQHRFSLQIRYFSQS